MVRGFWGRFSIAVEPLTIALCFSVLTVGLLLRHQEGAIFIAPIFGGAALLFYAYAVVLMISVTRALIESFGPIWAVDGYVRYRAQQTPDRDTAYYVAVLDEHRRILGEWPLDRRPQALDRANPGRPWSSSAVTAASCASTDGRPASYRTTSRRSGSARRRRSRATPATTRA